MSPQRTNEETEDFSFPRVSGDEPGVFARNFFLATFSPRERG